MNSAECRELDAWIAEHMFGKMKVAYVDRIFDNDANGYCHKFDSVFIAGKNNKAVEFHPTIDVPFAMQVLDVCIKKYSFGVEISYVEGKYHCWQMIDMEEIIGSAETLPMAICLYAKQFYIKLNNR